MSVRQYSFQNPVPWNNGRGVLSLLGALAQLTTNVSLLGGFSYNQSSHALALDLGGIASGGGRGDPIAFGTFLHDSYILRHSFSSSLIHEY